MNDILVLTENPGSIWGVFTDREIMYSMYENLHRANPQLKLRVQQIRPNTSIRVAEWEDVEAIRDIHHPCVKNKESASIPKELRAEFDRLQQRLAQFKGDFSVFKRMLEEGLLSLDTDEKDVPKLLQDKFPIFRDIVKFQVPDEEAFTYFMDRFYYTPPSI